MGFWCTCYQIGSAIATFFAAYVLGHWGWQSAFSVPAAVLLFIAVIYILFHKDTPEKVGLPPISEYHGEKAEQAPEKIDEPEKEGDKGRIIKEVLSHPIVWLMGLSYFCLTSMTLEKL